VNLKFQKAPEKNWKKKLFTSWSISFFQYIINFLRKREELSFWRVFFKRKQYSLSNYFVSQIYLQLFQLEGKEEEIDSEFKRSFEKMRGKKETIIFWLRKCFSKIKKNNSEIFLKVKKCMSNDFCGIFGQKSLLLFFHEISPLSKKKENHERISHFLPIFRNQHKRVKLEIWENFLRLKPFDNSQKY